MHFPCLAITVLEKRKFILCGWLTPFKVLLISNYFARDHESSAEIVLIEEIKKAVELKKKQSHLK
jgi:hypothetical protein